MSEKPTMSPTVLTGILAFEQSCIDAVINTATKLGADPVALAGACQDGHFLHFAVYDLARILQKQEATSLGEDNWREQLAALKRAGPKP